MDCIWAVHLLTEQDTLLKVTWICFSTQVGRVFPSIVAFVVFSVLGLDAEVGTPDPLEVLVDHVGLHGVEGVDPVPDVPVENVTLATPVFPRHFPDGPGGKGLQSFLCQWT